MAKRRSVTHAFWGSDRGLTLLTALLVALIFFVAPFIGQSLVSRLVIDLLFALILVSGVVSVSGSRRLARLAAMVALLPLFTAVVRYFTAAKIVEGFHAAGLALFLLLLVAVVTAQLFREGPITFHRIQGAVAIYLMLALIWGSLYQLVSLFEPAAFSGKDLAAGLPPRRETLYYFSFITLTTVGYGDVMPVAPLARSLAMLEGLTGQLFPAILIARLVAMEIASRK